MHIVKITVQYRSDKVNNELTYCVNSKLEKYHFHIFEDNALSPGASSNQKSKFLFDSFSQKGL
jgi:hypothetical protein